MKTLEQDAARHLRSHHGRTLNEIAATLEVSKSSASLWVRNVELTPTARERIGSRTGLGRLVSGERSAERARDVRRLYQLEGRERARTKDAGYVAGCMLYWAEGAKARNSAILVNSDPEVLVLFMAFLRTYFGVTNDRARVRCNLFADHVDRQREIEDYWLKRLELDRTSLRRSHVNVYSKYSKKRRSGKLPFGTCALAVHSTQIVQTIYGSIQEYGGFDRPEWLD